MTVSVGEGLDVGVGIGNGVEVGMLANFDAGAEVGVGIGLWAGVNECVGVGNGFCETAVGLEGSDDDVVKAK